MINQRITFELVLGIFLLIWDSQQQLWSDLNAFAGVYVNISKHEVGAGGGECAPCICECTLTDFDQAERTDDGSSSSLPPAF